MDIFGGVSPMDVEQTLQSLAVECALEVAILQPLAVPRSKQVLDVEEDVCDVDEDVQDLFAKKFAQRVPGVGIVGEEKGLSIPCTIPGHDVYVTVDSVDGTRNYLNGCYDGVAFMVALVADGRVVATYIVNVFTGEIVGFGPHSKNVRRWLGFNFDYEGENLHDIDRSRPLAEQPVVLRADLSKYSPEFRRLLGEPGGVFGDSVRMKGSIGLTFAHLVSGRAGAVALRCSEVSKTTPWDDIPLIGLCQMGYVFMRLNAGRNGLVQYVPSLPREICRRTHESLVVPRECVPELHAAAAVLLG